MKNKLKLLCVIFTTIILIAVTILILGAKPRIVLKGSQVETVKVSEHYYDEGASVYIYGLNFTNRMLITSNVDTSKVGIYTVKYSIKYRNRVYSDIRVVCVVADLF